MKNLRYITGHQIFPMIGSVPDKSVLVFDKNKLVDILPEKSVDPVQLERFNGTLVPGFVNAHCHLELSYMKGLIPTGTGLTPFLQAVVTQDPVPEEVALEAIKKADEEMHSVGIVAVGDICNLTTTIPAKKDSLIRYYNFVEMFDFLDQEKSTFYFEQYEAVYQQYIENGLTETVRVPHSTYTVSDRLMTLLGEHLPDHAISGSIHMLENDQENYLLIGRETEYTSFFEGLGFKMNSYVPPKMSSMQVFQHSNYQPERMLFVHNTIASEVDLNIMKNFHNTYLVTCPNANLYIESRLPDYPLWQRSGIPICIGTDSYASNHQLSIWNEIRLIKSRFEDIPWETLLQWATIHGARALGMEREIGSFECGKSPGVVLLSHGPGKLISMDSESRRII